MGERGEKWLVRLVAIAAVAIFGGFLAVASGHSGWIADKPVSNEQSAYFACRRFIGVRMQLPASTKWPRSDGSDVVYEEDGDAVEVGVQVDGRLFDCKVVRGTPFQKWLPMNVTDKGQV